MGDRVFAYGEDSRALRLASELADLRAANANRRICVANARRMLHPSQHKRHPWRTCDKAGAPTKFALSGK